MLDALTIDVEEYFQVSLFARHAPPPTWEARPRRAAAKVRELLDLLDERGAKATFFVLGWVAARDPLLVREIGERGHELASHGDEHRELTTLTPERFREDLRRARARIEDASGRAVVGFRAPSWSVVHGTQWALEILCREGYLYDSSVFPIRHDRYGIPDSPRRPHRLRLLAGSLIEVPPATTRVLGMNLPVAGGGYLRHLPFPLLRWGIERIHRIDGVPAVVYLHPWEIDPAQPRLPVPISTRIRHYRNLHRTRDRLDRLLRRFRFGTVREMLIAHPVDAPAPARAGAVAASKG